VVDSVADFRDALDRVPRELLDPQDARILTDAMTSADVLERLVSVPRSVVLVGCTGVGKSHLMNALVGADVTAVGVLRPTTRSIVMAGSAGPVPIAHECEYAVSPHAPEGLVFVDTPPWELDPGAVGAALAAADVGILVVSPTRYGDAKTERLWDSMATVSTRVVVLNRLCGSESERSEMIVLVKEQFAMTDISVVDEDGVSDSFVQTVVEGLRRAGLLDDKAAIARTSAASAAHHVARVVTAAAGELGRLDHRVDTLDPPTIRDQGMAVRESWLATEQEVVGQVHGLVDLLDGTILEACGGGIAERIVDSLGSWDPSETQRDLALWRDEAAARFRRDATIRWRRSFTEQLLDRTSWKVGVNPNVQVPRRVARVMKPNLGKAVSEVHERLVSIANAAVVQRRAAWKLSVERAGSFKPGELLAASDALSSR
jgi:hypothetical protein